MPTEVPRSTLPLKSIGHYDILQKIADGGMGSVYRGRDQQNGGTVAIKIVPPHMANNDVLLKRFRQEFDTASKLDHPNIVRALDFGMEGGSPYLVMEFVEGETLGQRIDRQGRIPEKDAIKIIAHISQGLHKAHSIGLVHRDVKPDNIIITPEGTAKLADLGLVKDSETDLNLTRTGRGLGTPQFMAPEQFRNAKNADARCDIYSLAATFYMALTGELPFRSCSPLDAWMKKVQNDFPAPRELNPQLSERVDWAIRRAMSADPQQRPVTCREFVEDLMGRTTKKLGNAPANGSVVQDVWYLVYSDETGSQHTVRGSTAAVRRCLKEGRLGDAENVRISRQQNGPFESLNSLPEFRDMVISPAAMQVTQSGRVVPKSQPNISGGPTPVKSGVKPQHAAQPVFRNAPIELSRPMSQPSRQNASVMTWIVFIVLLVAGFGLGLLVLLLLRN
jgi:eukaryotic-like serine/threonine-protein kinase